MKFEPFSIKWTTIPGNNEIAIIFDSTRGIPYRINSAVASGSAYLIPGGWNGRYPHALVSGFVKCTGTDVTAKFYGRTEFDNDANDWEVDASAPNAGTKTVTAGGGAWPFEWKPSCTDFLFRIDCTTAPTLLSVQIDILPTMDFGS